MDGNFEQCRQLVRIASRDRYLATLFAPVDHRDALFALYAFHCDVASIRERAREPMPGEIRLQWWREVLQGQRDGEAAAHPVAAALLQTMARYAIAPQPLLILLEACSFDLYDEPMKTYPELEDYAAKTSVTMFGLAAHVLAGRRPVDDAPIRSTGIAYALMETLLAFPLHSSRRQMFVPADILGHFGANTDDAFGGRVTPEWRAALAEIRIRARRHLDAAKADAASVLPEIMPALLPAALIRPTLALMERKNYQPFQPGEIGAWQRQWILWRAARDPARIFA